LQNLQGFIRALHFGGGKGIRTPDIQLAKLALYQLSYAPGEILLLAAFIRIASNFGRRRRGHRQITYF
jgi:hypothetical protein